jgi:phospholipase C
MADAEKIMSDTQKLAAIRENIQHVFVLMLENRSFDHMFALSGIPGIRAATSSNSNFYNGKDYPLLGDAPDQMPTDPGHEFEDVVEQLCGQGVTYQAGKPYPAMKNSGFVSNYATTHTEGEPPALQDADKIMRGIDAQKQTPSLYRLATEFVLCDAWHSSLPGPTWPNRYFLHGASSNGLDHSPSKENLLEWESAEGFTYPKGSIFDALGSGRYRLYQDETGPVLGRVPQVSSLKGISFFDVHNLSDLESDLKGDYPYAYTFIEPSYGDVGRDTYEMGSSQHPMDSLSGGDQLVAKVYNAVRNSPLWQNSLLIVTYDEHGGFYDSVQPGAAFPPNDGAEPSLNQHGFDFSVYGVRVPAIIASPWIAKGQVDHTLYDHGSVLATVEKLFDIPPLTDRDRNANDLLSLIGKECRTDCPERIG